MVVATAAVVLGTALLADGRLAHASKNIVRIVGGRVLCGPLNRAGVAVLTLRGENRFRRHAYDQRSGSDSPIAQCGTILSASTSSNQHPVEITEVTPMKRPQVARNGCTVVAEGFGGTIPPVHPSLWARSPRGGTC